MTAQDALDRLARYAARAAHPDDRASLEADIAEVRAALLEPEDAQLILLWKRDAARHGFPMGTRDDDLAARLAGA